MTRFPSLAAALLALTAAAHATDPIVFTDQATFLAATGAANATGPLPDLGLVVSASVGSVTFSVAPGGDNLAIGASGTLADPDWCPLTPGHDIALGWENLQVDLAAPAYALGFDLVQPDASMPPWGGTPVDSIFEVTLLDAGLPVGVTQFSSIPVDVVTFLGVWSSVPFTSATIIEVTASPFLDDDEFFGEFYTGDTPAPSITLVPCTDKAAFLALPGAASASGPLPNLGTVGSARLGSLEFGIAPGGDDLSIGAFNTGAEPDWCPLIPGHDIAQGYENLSVTLDQPVLALGFDFVQPDATMPPYGGTPVESTFEVRLFAGGSLLGQVAFSAIPVDELVFLGVCSDVAFDRAEIIDVTESPFVDDDEFYGEFFCVPAAGPWANLGHGLGGLAGDPLLFGTGTLQAGSDGWLVLVAAAGGSPAALFVSLSAVPTPFKGGTLLTVPVLATIPLATDGFGEIALPWLDWPAGLSGVSLHFQYAVQDAAGPKGVSLSNALRADVP